jgi:hypothetical protein
MISVLPGTNPEIVNMLPTNCACSNQGPDYAILPTGQDDSYAMERIFSDLPDLPMS